MSLGDTQVAGTRGHRRSAYGAHRPLRPAREPPGTQAFNLDTESSGFPPKPCYDLKGPDEPRRHPGGRHSGAQAQRLWPPPRAVARRAQRAPTPLAGQGAARHPGPLICPDPLLPSVHVSGGRGCDPRVAALVVRFIVPLKFIMIPPRIQSQQSKLFTF